MIDVGNFDSIQIIHRFIWGATANNNIIPKASNRRGYPWHTLYHLSDIIVPSRIGFNFYCRKGLGRQRCFFGCFKGIGLHNHFFKGVLLRCKCNLLRCCPHRFYNHIELRVGFKAQKANDHIVGLWGNIFYGKIPRCICTSTQGCVF